MRGLTTEERHWLILAADVANHKLSSIETLLAMTVGARLATQGRATKVGLVVAATDLGRLALRVCPVEES